MNKETIHVPNKEGFIEEVKIQTLKETEPDYFPLLYYHAQLSVNERFRNIYSIMGVTSLVEECEKNIKEIKNKIKEYEERKQNETQDQQN